MNEICSFSPIDICSFKIKRAKSMESPNDWFVYVVFYICTVCFDSDRMCVVVTVYTKGAYAFVFKVEGALLTCASRL